MSRLYAALLVLIWRALALAQTHEPSWVRTITNIPVPPGTHLFLEGAAVARWAPSERHLKTADTSFGPFVCFYPRGRLWAKNATGYEPASGTLWGQYILDGRPLPPVPTHFFPKALNRWAEINFLEITREVEHLQKGRERHVLNLRGPAYGAGLLLAMAPLLSNTAYLLPALSLNGAFGLYVGAQALDKQRRINQHKRELKRLKKYWGAIIFQDLLEPLFGTEEKEALNPTVTKENGQHASASSSQLMAYSALPHIDAHHFLRNIIWNAKVSLWNETLWELDPCPPPETWGDVFNTL